MPVEFRGYDLPVGVCGGFSFTEPADHNGIPCSSSFADAASDGDGEVHGVAAALTQGGVDWTGP